MLLALRAEEDEQWVDYTFCDGEVSPPSSNLIEISYIFCHQTTESNDAFENIFGHQEEILECQTDITEVLKGIPGL